MIINEYYIRATMRPGDRQLPAYDYYQITTLDEDGEESDSGYDPLHDPYERSSRTFNVPGIVCCGLGRVEADSKGNSTKDDDDSFDTFFFILEECSM